MSRLQARLIISFIGLALSIIFSKLIGVEVVSGEQGLVYQYTWESAITLGVVTVVLAGAATFMLTKWRGPAMLVGLVPAALAFVCFTEACDMAMADLVIGPTELALPGYGLVLRDYHRLEFHELRSVTLRTEPGAARGDYRSMPSYRLEFLKKDGTLVTIPGSTLARAAEKEILQALQSHQVPVRDAREAG